MLLLSFHPDSRLSGNDVRGVVWLFRLLWVCPRAWLAPHTLRRVSDCLLQFGEFLFDGFFGHKAAHFVVVEQHDGGVAAGAHAFAFDKGEFAVGGGFAVADAEFFLQILAGIDAAAQGAGEVGADGAGCTCCKT